MVEGRLPGQPSPSIREQRQERCNQPFYTPTNGSQEGRAEKQERAGTPKEGHIRAHRAWQSRSEVEQEQAVVLFAEDIGRIGLTLSRSVPREGRSHEMASEENGNVGMRRQETV